MSRERSDNLSYDEVAPDAYGMIESLRAHGYTLSTALADIIDNSISANCSNIWIRVEWNNGDPWISITDDGKGMSEVELVDAMRLASKNPLDKRSPKDLGRFGLGLKTASFSQARRLTVLTKKVRSAESLRRWDLDYLAKPSVSGWRLLKQAHEETGDRLDELQVRKIKSGTVVLLEVLDRIDSHKEEEGQRTAKDLVFQLEQVRKHLSMVFHRFMESGAQGAIKIFLNENKLTPWDPFCTNEGATQIDPEDHDKTLGSRISVRGYILPHKDRFGTSCGDVEGRRLHAEAAGPLGWNAHQGFYLYRNKRLIIPGDWLGLGPRGGWKKEEHYKLARIRLDISNSLDQEWQIDVKKSNAIAPPALKLWLSGLAKNIRERAKEIYSHRGGRTVRATKNKVFHVHPWVSKKTKEGSFNYKIDRKHPLIKALLKKIDLKKDEELETLLRLLEESIPIQQIWIDTADNQEGIAKPFEGESAKKLRNIILKCYSALTEESNYTEEEAWAELAVTPALGSKEARALIGILKEQLTNKR